LDTEQPSENTEPTEADTEPTEDAELAALLTDYLSIVKEWNEVINND
jgi:hypothetical protein